MIHIGRSETKRTLCDKSAARRWWVEAADRRYSIGPAGLRCYEDVRPTGYDCPECAAKAAS
jgi:hypothetical protein